MFNSGTSPTAIASGPTIVAFVIGTCTAYAALRITYCLCFHPLSKFPGPRLAAVSNLWYGYHWLTGRWPWVIESVLREYGDVVRIAPNELVFFTPKAFQDIYSPHQRSIESFVKTNFNDRGKNLGGIVWEEDPVRHRAVAKQLSPAFSTRTIRAMEPVVHQHIDYFVSRIKELGSAPEGINIVDWTHWLAMDISADLSWNEQLNEMRDMKDAVFLEVLMAFNAFTTVIQVFKRFPLLSPLQYLLAPMAKLSSLSKMQKAVNDGVMKRVEGRTDIKHLDYFDFILPKGQSLPSAQGELLHIGSLSIQVMFANFGPLADWLYAAILCLLEEPQCYRALVEEIRDAFETYDDITPVALASLPYLHACLEESLRLFPSNNTGLPRYSPGATVDGHYIPKGYTVQTSTFTLGRSPRFFHEARKYRPQRYLRPGHPLYDAAFANDDLKGYHPFSLGPRICMGREMAWVEGKLIMAKVLWTFDLIKTPGQPDFSDVDRDLVHYGFFVKPELRVRFVLVKR